jgi:hypothetical protein
MLRPIDRRKNFRYFWFSGLEPRNRRKKFVCSRPDGPNQANFPKINEIISFNFAVCSIFPGIEEENSLIPTDQSNGATSTVRPVRSPWRKQQNPAQPVPELCF